MTKYNETHANLKLLVEIPVTSYLWTPADEITFVPRVLSTVYGDGRALFALTTINDRPAYWIILGDSGWQAQDIHAPADAPDFGDFTDEILADLEDEFGSARCGYQGASLRIPVAERECDCEECSDPRIIDFPSIDDEGGCSWARMNWPAEIGTIDHPWTWHGNLLALEEEMAFSAAHPCMAIMWERWRHENLSIKERRA